MKNFADENVMSEEQLFDLDYELFCKYMKWNNSQEKYNYKRMLKNYKDTKPIKQMFNLIVNLMENDKEKDKMLEIKEKQVRELKKDNKGYIEAQIKIELLKNKIESLKICNKKCVKYDESSDD
tara:strand:+ start:179 stop:547 length:369 start_codon:yes stop_codon:yes gene_type:complete